MWQIIGMPRDHRVMEPENVVAIVVGSASAIIAVIAVIVSGIANSRASAANLLATEANEIAGEELEHVKLAAPPPWGQIEAASGRRKQFSVENKSGRAIRVLELTAEPADSADAVTFRNVPGSVVDYGDAIIFAVDPSIAQDPRAIRVSWVYEDRADGDAPMQLRRTLL